MKKILGFLLLLSTLIIAQKVACIGNSITDTAYPSYLDYKTTATVRGFGVPGAGMCKAHPIAYWNSSSFTEVKAWNPDYVIILLGTNDSCPQFWNDTMLTPFENNYREFLTHFSGGIYIGILPYIMPITAQPIRNTNIDEINGMLKNLAAEKGLQIINFNTALKQEHYKTDHLHLNNAGLHVMATTAWNVLKDVLPEANCVDIQWLPDPASIPAGQEFTQISNCGNARTAVGIKKDECVDTSWQPDPATIPAGQQFTQTSNCGNTRTAIGTKESEVLEDIILTLEYDDPVKCLRLTWTDIPETDKYQLNKEWYNNSDKLGECCITFNNNQHKHVDGSMVSLQKYYYFVQAFKNGSCNHKSKIMEFTAPEYLSIVEEEYQKEIEDYEKQRNSGVFRGCSWQKLK